MTVYQVVEPGPARDYFADPTSPRGNSTAAAVSLLASTVDFFQNLALARQTQQALEAPNIQNQIRAANNSGLGALVNVQIDVWYRQGRLMSPTISFLSLFVMGSGRTPREVIQSFSQSPQMYSGIGPQNPATDRMVVNRYLWCTR